MRYIHALVPVAALIGLAVGAFGYRATHRLPPAPPSLPVIGPGSIAYEKAVEAQVRRAAQLEGSLMFFGDSLTVGLATSKIADNAENFGINSDTILGLTRRIGSYNLEGQRAVNLEIGINDLRPLVPARFKDSYSQLLAKIPSSVPVVALSITPTGPKSLPTNREVDLANGKIRLACQERAGCRYLDLNTRLKADGHLALRFDAGDGIHISPAGSLIWATMLSDTLKKLP